ncbi:MAG: hypothetical protein ACYDD1_22215 [Caulobacteraceae bacterium]
MDQLAIHTPKAVAIWKWAPSLTVGRISACVISGTPDLDRLHRVTLLVYARSLTASRLERNDARVWMNAHQCAGRIGARTERIRWHLQNLSSAGYLACATNPATPLECPL